MLVLFQLEAYDHQQELHLPLVDVPVANAHKHVQPNAMESSTPSRIRPVFHH